MAPTAEEIRSTQGTRLDERAPWMTYASEMEERLDPQLAAEVAEYAKRRYSDDQASSQSKEVLAEQKEINAGIASQYQWVKPEEYAELEPRIGRVMSHAEFITRLRGAGVTCWYTQHVHPDKAVLHVQRGRQEPEVACWVQIGQMPELSMMHFDDHGAPLAERRRGWRTCLLQVILKGILSEEKANQVYGEPKSTRAFHRYNATLQAYRNAGSTLGQ